MKVDLTKFTRKELEKLISDAQKRLSTLDRQDREAARAAAEKAAKEHGFSLNDLVGAAPKKSARKPKAAAKYKNPADPTQTWSGRGRKPGWFKEAESAGKKPEDMAI